MSAENRALVSAGVLTVLGFGLLWWAHHQWLNARAIMGSTFEMPSTRLMLWLLTLVVAGLSFGLAAASARREKVRARAAVLLIWSLIPLTVLIGFWLFVSGWWSPVLGPFTEFLYSETTLVSSSLVLGFFIAGLIPGTWATDPPPPDQDEGQTE